MGVVYEAEDIKLERRVALKFLGPERVANDQSRQRFLREARSAAALNHPNICAVYEIDEAGGQLFIAMEYCEGWSLREMIRKGPLPIPTAVSIVLQVADALAEAHRRQIVHRDVKSANIMVDGKNRARLLDFGLASLGESTESTLTIQFMGTPAYMAPERLTLHVNDACGDIWALGVVLYEAIAGQLPFGGDQQYLMYSILNEEPPPLSSLRTDAPEAFEAIVDKALAKDPADRYQTVGEMAADLAAAQREHSREEASRPPASMGEFSRPSMTAGPSSGAERINAVAVLPFVNMSREAEDEFLSEGLAEEITNALTQVRGLRVVSRASTFQFKSPSPDLREAGRRLRVQALVLGTVRRQQQRLRVTAQLVKASNSYQLWSRRFDCEMKDVFDLEDQLTAAIVENLRQWLGAEFEMSRLRGGTTDANAYELYLRGRYAFNLQTAEGVAEARRYFIQALELSPRYALARVGLADCYALEGWYGMRPPLEVIPAAKAELEAALAIEDALPSAWRMKAAITAGFDWNWERARAEFQKAFSLGPPTSDLYFQHALDFLTPLGSLEKALEEMKLALELDPAAPLIATGVGGCLYRLRRYPAALRQLQATIELAPGFYHAHWTLARVERSMGSLDSARRSFERALAVGGSNIPALAADAAHCRARMGDAAGARRMLEELKSAPLPAAIVHLGLGEIDAALACMQDAVQHRSRSLIWLGVDPRFDEVRDRPEFRAVLNAMGLANAAPRGDDAARSTRAD